MNDLDDRLTDLLARSAGAVDVRPDLDAVLDDDVLVDLDRLRQRRRPRRASFALAAAAILLVAVIAAVALAGTGGDDGPEGVTDAPVGPAERYPVLDALPADLAGRVVARGGPLGDVILTHLDTFPEETPTTRAVLGRVADDGTVTEVMIVQATPGRMDAETVIPGAEPTTIAGRPADVWVDSSSGATAAVIVGDGASALVHGPRGTAENLAGIERVRLESGDDRPVLELDGLPTGLEVLVAPGPLEAGEGVEVGAGELGEPSITVSTGIDDPLAVVAESGGTATAVEVGGHDGWMVEWGEDGAMVTWRGPGGVALIAQGRLSPEDTLLVARGVRLVDEQTWLATYDHGPDGVPVDDAGSGDDPVGSPAPPLEGITYADRWTVVGMSRGGCNDEWCSDAVFDALVGVEDDATASEVQLVGLVDETEGDGIADARAVGFDGPVVLGRADDIMQTWAIDVLPAFVIVDPEGIVAHITTGPVTTGGILAALAGSFGDNRDVADDDDPTTSSVPERLGQPAPAFEGALAEVGTFTPPQDQGEWAIVTIGRADCPMCVEQVEVLAEYVAEHPDGPGSPVTLLVDEDDGFPERITAFADEHGADWPVLAITEEQERLWGAQGGGAVVVIDPQGVVQIYVGGFDDADELAAMLEDVGAE